METISNGLASCEAAVEVDIPELVEMGQIFKSPSELIVQVGKDLLLNGRSIKKDISAGISDFDAELFEQSGKDFGEALSLVLFGKPKRDTIDTLPSDYYNAYLAVAGYATLYQPTSDDFQSIYAASPVFGEDFYEGFSNVYSGSKPTTTSDIALFLHKVGFLFQNVVNDL